MNPLTVFPVPLPVLLSRLRGLMLGCRELGDCILDLLPPRVLLDALRIGEAVWGVDFCILRGEGRTVSEEVVCEFAKFLAALGNPKDAENVRMLPIDGRVGVNEAGFVLAAEDIVGLDVVDAQNGVDAQSLQNMPFVIDRVVVLPQGPRRRGCAKCCGFSSVREPDLDPSRRVDIEAAVCRKGSSHSHDGRTRIRNRYARQAANESR
ncbi:hypothetical protein VFPBJ_10919 [Purpureocillium lilacinum]|uniref:Uncharacterized protein n=1 Tax=Purpureocillium lilacinum TaxID=33203 RepID=A0A179FVA6_PURLI|nr:hypothetical protein VFPBJ_10919 [Purpureocillium lilacinum]